MRVKSTSKSSNQSTFTHKLHSDWTFFLLIKNLLAAVDVAVDKKALNAPVGELLSAKFRAAWWNGDSPEEEFIFDDWNWRWVNKRKSPIEKNGNTFVTRKFDESISQSVIGHSIRKTLSFYVIKKKTRAKINHFGKTTKWIVLNQINRFKTEVSNSSIDLDQN